MNLEDLKKPFPAEDIEWRVGRAGMNDKVWAEVLAYITNRAIMNRLDEVCGAENWKNEFKFEGKTILCGLSIKINGEWMTKWDGSEETDFEAVKGGLSGAQKRAGVQWGIGRYLYKLPASFAKVHDKGKHYQAEDKKNKKYPAFRWDEPELPAWALPISTSTNAEGERDELLYVKEEIRNCKTLVELRSIWDSLPKTDQEKLASLKDEIKNKLSKEV